jgi:hypothetical protein
MAKVTQPMKEFWESDKKPDYLKLSKTKDSSVQVVRFIGLKPKRKSKKSELNSSGN